MSEKVKLYYMNLGNAIDLNDKDACNRYFWALYYEIWPERRKKSTPPTEKIASEMLSPDQIQAKMNDIGRQMHFVEPEKAE